MKASVKDIITLNEAIQTASLIVFYGGAGTSTESGIPDYRSRHGRWTSLEKDGFEPVKIANPRFIKENPEEFFKKREGEPIKPKPNTTHYYLAKLEKHGKDVRVITQNVDGLHQMAGHRYVLELHGNHRTWHCMTCGREYLYQEIERDENNVPRCYVDQGIVRPNVVYFGESANRDTVTKARDTLSKADLLIIAGTSLTTPLARRLVQDYGGDKIIVINHDELDISPLVVDLFIQASVGEVFRALEELKQGAH